VTTTNPSPRFSVFLPLVAVVLAAAAQPALAQVSPPNLGEATLEELMAVQVTSASRKAQRVEDVAAAVFVITRDDIRRSGLTTLPEILRLAPGVQVAQVNASKWAVSIRGFNDMFANKLLVLIDGRSVYTRMFGGVLWESQDLLVNDIERIEIIRGPGGAMWGANAVNGVINVITRSAAATPGLSVELSAGTFERDRASVRYGGYIGQAAYRVFSQWSGYGDTQTAAGGSADDRWNSLLTGARVDWSRGADTFMTQAQYTDGRSRPRWADYSAGMSGVVSFDGVSNLQEVSALARWTRTKATGSLLQAQASHMTGRHTESILDWRERATDLDVQYEMPERARQSIVVGGGLRAIDLWTKNTFTLNLQPRDSRIFNAFVQDEIAVGRQVSFILGSKVEHDGEAGWGVLPSARLLWRTSPNQRVWGAVSRARRTPSATDQTLRYLTTVDVGGATILAGFVGNPEYRSEDLVEAEAGYRLRLGPAASVEVAVFQGSYDDLPTREPLGLVVEPTPEPGLAFFAQQSANLLRARTRGTELNAQWSPTNAWRLSGSYSFFDLTASPDPASHDLTASLGDGSAPRHQWQAHSATSLGPRLHVDLGIYHTGALRRIPVRAYTRADVRVQFDVADRLSVIATGRNLFDPSHWEFNTSSGTYLASSIPRSAQVMLRWKL
jgi:iron complex outermembrane receptor protein